MTQAAFGRQDDGYHVSVTGHADYGSKGEDIVCAACSILSFTLLQSLMALQESGGIRRLNYRTGDGELWMEFWPKAEYADQVEMMLWTIRQGFDLLQKKYPEHVKCYVKTGES